MARPFHWGEMFCITHPDTFSICGKFWLSSRIWNRAMFGFYGFEQCLTCPAWDCMTVYKWFQDNTRGVVGDLMGLKKGGKICLTLNLLTFYFCGQNNLKVALITHICKLCQGVKRWQQKDNRWPFSSDVTVKVSLKGRIRLRCCVTSCKSFSLKVGNLTKYHYFTADWSVSNYKGDG